MAELNGVSWSKKDQKVSLGVLAAIVLGAVIFFGSEIGDFVVSAFDNMLHLALVGCGIFVLGWLLVDKKFQMALVFLYMSFLRVFFRFDPLGNLKSIRSRFIDRLEQFTKSLGELRGQRRKTQASHDEAAKNKQNELGLLAVAQKQGKQLQMQLSANNLHRFEETIADDEKQLALYDTLIERLSRGHELCTFKIEDMKGEIEHREKQMEDARISRSVVKSAMGILKGSGMEQDIWDSSNRQIEAEYNAALGEVDNLLDLTKDVFEKADTLQAANVENALRQLDAWNTKNEGIMTGKQRGALPAPSASITMTPGAKPNYAPVRNQPTTGDDDYLGLMK